MNLTRSVKFEITQIVPPFNFDLTAKAFSDEIGLCMRDEQISKYSNGKYWRVLRINDKLILITVRSIGKVNKPKLEVELVSNREISGNDKEIARKTISRIFDLDFDLKPFYGEARNDKVMSKLIDRLYGLKIPRCPTIFEALVYVILEQQISLVAAYNIENRLVKRFGESLEIDDRTYYAFPTPQKLASLEIDDLRSCGLSQRKAEYIRDVARLIVEKKLDLEALKYKNDEEILKELCEIRGVGPWTAELVMIRGMAKLSVIPAADLGLREHIAHYYFKDRKRVSTVEVRRISKKWGKWAGLAGYYPVVAGRLKIEV